MKDRDSAGKVTFAASQYGKEKQYWLNQFSGELKKSSFPYDHFPTTMDPVGTGTDVVNFSFPRETSWELIQLSKDIQHRLYMILTAGLVALLYKYTGNTDIIFGSPIFKQEREGEFINTVLPLRIQINERITYKELLLQGVRPTVTEATEHQNYPVETLLFQLGMPVSGKEFPLFDVVILLENIQHKKNIRQVHPNIIFSFLRTGVGEIKGELEYNPHRYDSATAQRIVRHFQRLVEEALVNMNTPVSGIEILSEQEKQQLLVEFNGSRSEYPAGSTIDRLFADLASSIPDELALTYEDEFLTYNRLNEEANRLASNLHLQGLKPGEPAAVMVENSPLAVISLLGILKAGGAYLPLNVEYPDERKKYMLDDCKARFLLTNCLEAYKFHSTLTLMDLENSSNDEHQAAAHPGCNHHGNDLAYIMYTSGSTGTPKGIMVEHKNVIRLVRNTNFIQFKKGDRLLLTGALEFDASTFEIWGPLLNGLTLHLANKDTILNPDQLKATIRKNRVSTMWMTSPLFNQLLDADIEIFAGIGNLLVGGDVLSPPHIFRLKRRFPRLKIIDGYGPTENTTFSTTFLVENNYLKNIPIGKPIANSTVYILDGLYHLVPIGVSGELYVGGDGLSRGYLNNPRLTAEKFVTFDNSSYKSYRTYRTYISQKIYKTGDRVRWLPDGNIQFLGRFDFQVKIRGYRIEPGEIENQLRQFDGIKEVVVIDRKNRDDEKYLCGYLVLAEEERERFDVVELRKTLAMNLPDYMVPAHFVQLEKLPLTSNGKIDRKALPEPEITWGGVAYAAPRNPVEEKLMEIWSEVLRIETETISIDSNFFELGGHSLKATILISKLNKTFNVKVPLAELFRIPTIRELGELIKKLEKDTFSSIKAVEEKEYYQLSAAQKRHYFLQQLEPDSTVYNVPFITVLQEKFNLRGIEDTLKRLIKRHGSLRTSFHLINDEPVQRIHEAVEFVIQYYDSQELRQLPSSGWENVNASSFGFIRGFIKAFDLSTAPLMRVGLLKLEEKKFILAVDMHHIITDGTSMSLCIDEFIRLKQGQELPALRLQYKDYSEWYNSKAHKEVVRLQEEYWLKQFKGELPVLNLPTDYSRPVIQSFEGNTLEFQLPFHRTRELNDFFLRTGTTLFMMLLAVYNILLFKLSGQEDIVVGTPIAARRHADLEKIIGMFVNTLALRNFPHGDQTFEEFLNHVKQRTLEAFENQEYQFEDLVDLVMANRDTSRNPIFDNMFALQNMDPGYESRINEEVDIPSANPASQEFSQKDLQNILNTSKFDLSLTAVEINRKLFFSIQYCTKLFKTETIVRFIVYFGNIISIILEKPGIRLREIEIMSEEEKKRILYDFSGSEMGFPKAKTLHLLFKEQMEISPDHIAVVGQGAAVFTGTKHLPTLTNENASLSSFIQITYHELNDKAHQLACWLREEGVAPDTIVGIMVERSVEMIIGILGIIKSGGAYLPIDVDYPQERIDFMLNDSGARILLTDDLIMKATQLTQPTQLAQLRQPYHLAYIIYTSGSSGKPKGVMIEHRNASGYLYAFNREFDLTGIDIVIQQASFTFDAFLEEVYPVLLKGGKIAIPNWHQVRDIHLLQEFINKHSATVISCTPLILNLLNQGNKLNSVKLFISGGDVLKGEYIGNLLKWGKVYNTYGPTETTVCATYYHCSDGIKSNVPLGKAIANYNVYIFDNHRMVPVGVAGEICVAGVGVARGYLNNPELTAEKFVLVDGSWLIADRAVKEETADFPMSYQQSTISYIYKTGDLGRFLSDGNIEFLGRIDQQVKLRGFRIELGEIESRLSNHPGIKEAVVVAREEENGDKYLCAYIVFAREDVLPELGDYLTMELPDYMIPAYFVPLEKIPLTPNGKIDRKALPKPELSVGAGYAAPRDEIETKLIKLWSTVLNLEREFIGIDSNFFQLGGHSLKAMILSAKMHKAFNVRVPLLEVFKTPRIRELAEYIKEKSQESYISIDPAEEKEYYALSPAQKRLYVLQQLVTDNTGYNMPYVIPLVEGVNKERLESVFKGLIARHESLRTSFKTVNEEPVQRIHRQVDFSMGHYELREEAEAAALISGFTRPFDLSKAPILRVNLVTVGSSRRVLFIEMHHILTDGTSQDILEKEFMALYLGKELSRLRLQYKDYSQWCNSISRKEAIRRQEGYWLNEFSGELPVLNLPTDYPRPVVQRIEGNLVSFSLNGEETAIINTIIKENDVTLYMLLLAVFNVLISKLSGQEDIIIGTPIAARRHADLQDVIGMLVNTLAIRNYPAGDKTFRTFLKEIKQRTLDAYENQEYPFEELVDKLTINRDTSRNPLFDVMFNLLNQGEYKGAISPMNEPDPYRYIKKTSNFDLSLTAAARGERIYLSFEYSTRLFTPATIERLIGYFKNILKVLSGDRELKLEEIEIMGEEEKKEILRMSCGVEGAYEPGKTLDMLFAEQVEISPGGVAVIGSSLGASHELTIQITYRELSEKSAALAQELREIGVRPESIVGIMVDRTVELIMGIVAVLKAGGAYLPIDPNYPKERIKFMLSDSNAGALMTNNAAGLNIIGLNQITLPNHQTQLTRRNSASLAYIIYTSGSTGKPKGVMIEHRNASGYLNAFNREFDLTGIDIVIQQASFTFDAFFEEVYPVLLKGGRIAIPNRHQVRDTHLLQEFINKHSATVISCTPLILNLLNQGNKLNSVKLYISGGDVLKGEYIENLLKSGKVYNTYGPTETTVCATYYRCSAGIKSNVPLGKPIANYNVNIFDNHRMVPVGVVGEICIAGIGVARGYLNNPQLTAEKFVLAHGSWLLADRAVKEETADFPMSTQRSTISYIYKTGDLGRFLSDGDIEFLGRIDYQVKIRGFRVELGEIENRLSNHPGIKEAVVVAQEEENGDTYLCAYMVSDREYLPPELQDYLAMELPDYMIPAYFVPLENIPLTPNGKIDRKALPKPELRIAADYAAPRNEIETKLVELWSNVLKIDKNVISIDSSFFQLGGHSLNAMILASRIHKEFEVRVPLVEVFKTPRIRELAQYIKGKSKETYISINPVEEKEYYALSPAQKRLYILQQLITDNIVYNMPYVIPLVEGVDKEKLESVFKGLTERYESLRTSFITVNEEPVQRIHRQVDFSLDYYEITEEAETAALVSGFTRPFDLSKAPILRVNLVTVGSSRRVLFIDMHHIITDGISQDILEKAFMALYWGEELPLLRIQCKDYSEWCNSISRKEAIRQQAGYWLKEFSEELPILNLPTDYPRPVLQGSEGNIVGFSFDAEETETVKRMAKDNDTTLYMCLLAVFNVLLSKLSGQEDIIIGTPIAARRHADLQNVIGMLVNTLAIRNYPSGEKVFKEFLQEVRKRTLQAYENQEYPFEELVDKITVNRDTSRNPVFDVMFNLLNQGEYNGDISPMNKQDSYQHIKRTSKFDLNLAAMDMGERIRLRFEYSTRLFTPGTIERIIGYFKNILKVLSRNTELKISEIEIMGEEEKKEILRISSGVEGIYEPGETIHRLFAKQVEISPDHIAVIGQSLGASHALSIQITYRKLNEKSNGLGQLLKQKGVKTDTIVGIMVGRSIEMLIGILGIMKAGGAYLPIDPDYPQERKQYMLKDSGAKIHLTWQETAGLSSPEAFYNSPKGTSSHLHLSPAPVTSLAYIIYTSGSTGKPKGVPVEHSSVVNLVLYQTSFFGIDSLDRILQFSSICFDASVEQIFIALTSGAVLILVDKDTLLDSEKFAAYISQHLITHLHSVPSFLTELKFKGSFNLKRLISGGDICPKELPKTWCRHCNVYNKYGPTETTVTSLELLLKEPEDTLTALPIGIPVGNTTVYLFDKWLKLVPIGVTGELYIGGSGVARGYLNRPELTAEKFCLRRPGGKRIAHGALRSAFCAFRTPPRKNFLLKGTGKNHPLPHSPIYRTGDLSRWLPNGNVEFLGRIDQQIKIRGFRMELGEIEGCLLNCPGINEVVVLAREEEKGNKYLCAYMVSDREYVIPELREYLAMELPDYMIPAYFVPLEKIPLTPNGKIDRKALPKPDLRIGAGYAAPRNEFETKLVELWSNVLNIERDVISIDSNFFQLGGHSLNAMILIAKIHKVFDVRVPLLEVFKTARIRELAEYIKGKSKETYISIDPAEEKEYYTLSPAQKRLYVLQQLMTDNTGYNMPYVIPLVEGVDKEKLESVFKGLIERHESLRTSFITVNEEPVQKIHRQVDFSIGFYELTEEAEDIALVSGFTRPFDLDDAPILRVNLVTVGSSRRFLFIDMHHIITDGISQDILEKQFMALYWGEELPLLRLQYKDYSEWKNSAAQTEAIKQQQTYWLKEFDDELPVLNLPTDYPRPLVQSFDGNVVSFLINAEETRIVKTIVKENNVTLYMCLLAVFNVLLSKLSGQEDIIIGTPIAARRHADLQDVIGMLVNTLTMRNYPSGEKVFKEFLREVKERTLQAYENQEYPFEELVNKITVSRDISRNPLFDVTFNLLNQGEYKEDRSPMTELDSIRHLRATSKFDLSLAATNLGERIHLSFEYSTRLFTPVTIERIIGYFKNTLKVLSGDRGLKISEIEIMGEEEKKEILRISSGVEGMYEPGKTIHKLFTEQVEISPDRIAVIGSSLGASHELPIQITYRELNKKSNGLAQLLRQKRVVADTIVGIMAGRSIETIIGILGILKAGGAYLPIDPEYPQGRIAFMLEDSNVRVLVTTPKLQVKVKAEFAMKSSQPQLSLQFVNLNTYPAFASEPSLLTSTSTLTCQVSSTNLAYIIYTSGTTGKPKGVLINHRNVVRLLFNDQFQFDFSEKDSWTLFHSFCFDFSVWEMYGALLYGGKLVIIPKMVARDTRTFLKILKEKNVTILNQTPSAFYNLIEEELHQLGHREKQLQLRYIIFGGEALNPGKLKEWNETYPATTLINMYGITETTVHVTFKEITPEVIEAKISNIGQSLPTLNIYVMDKNLTLLPYGIPGELSVGGHGVARGYLNRPELTGEKFVDNPYKPGQKLYRSGDLVKQREDGEMEYLGRIDQQVKIRGYRVELGEIENHFMSFAGVKEAVVVANEDNLSNSKQLAAYITPDPEHAYPVIKILELKDKGELTQHHSYELPNGKTVFYLNKSETDFMYEEIFDN
ncbi:MAG: amino acid adenylation domain-containing protein, partial [Candidatus Aminicenantes bacterium]